MGNGTYGGRICLLNRHLNLEYPSYFFNKHKDFNFLISSIKTRSFSFLGILSIYIIQITEILQNEGEDESKAYRDAFRPCLRVSSDGFDLLANRHRRCEIDYRSS
jgi:hypothetical protein